MGGELRRRNLRTPQADSVVGIPRDKTTSGQANIRTVVGQQNASGRNPPVCFDHFGRCASTAAG